MLLEVFLNLWGLPFSPLHPDNNVNYVTDDFGVRLDWYNTVRGGSAKVLAVQQAFVRKVVEESLPYRNVLYVINNQYFSCAADQLSADSLVADQAAILANRDSALAWPRYWARFIKELGNEQGESLLVSTMPHFHPKGSPNAERVQWYVDEDLFDFVDAGWW